MPLNKPTIGQTNWGPTLNAALDYLDTKLVTTGNVTFNGVKIIGSGTASGDGSGYGTLELVPDSDRYSSDQYLVIDPTAPNHIHIRAGGAQDGSSAELILGGEQANVRIWDGSHTVAVQSYNSELDTSYYWYFNNDGALSGPAMGGLIVYSLSGASDEYPLGIYSADRVLLTGTNGVFLNDADVPNNQVATIGDLPTGATGSFTTADNKTVTVTDGIITSIV